jgi:hypothetical protein
VGVFGALSGSADELDLDPPIPCPVLRCPLARLLSDRTNLHPTRIDAVRDEIALHALGALEAESFVVARCPARIGVSVDVHVLGEVPVEVCELLVDATEPRIHLASRRSTLASSLARSAFVAISLARISAIALKTSFGVGSAVPTSVVNLVV